MWSRTALVLVLVLVLVCWSVTPAEPREGVTRSGSLDFGSVPAELYETVAHYEPGGVGMLFSMVHAFLHVVQPNPFPEDLVITMAKEKFGGVQSEYQKVLYYEVGFVVCVSLGVAFSVLLPLVGLLFCLCRCCNNCGGEMHQRQRKNAECLRGLLTTLLLTTTFIITAGVLCAYAANQNLSSQLKSMRRLVKSNLRDLHTFTNQTPAQIDYVISQYGTVKRHVLYDLENVGSILGGKIHSELEKGVQPALDATLSMTGTMRDTKDALENVSLTLETLQDGTSKLQSNLSLVRTSLANACSAPAPPAAQVCRNIRQVLPRLEIAANYSSLSDVTEQLNSVNHVLKTDLSLIVEKGLASFNDTPTMVTDQTRNIVEGVKVLLDDIGTNISSFTTLFPIHASLVNFSRVITHTHSQIEDVYPQIDQMDFYRWIVCISLCCMVVLILTFNFLGLLCGIMGFDRHSSPTTRGCVSNTGGNLLMAGVGFSFMFCWALMVVVTALFLLGGNLEKLVCEPFQTRQLFKVIDTPNLVHSTWRNFIPGYLYNDPDMDLTAYSLYSNCKDNRGIYSALHLDKIFNISAFFNTSVFSADLSKRFAGMKVDLRSIILLEAEGKQNLISFTETGISEIDFAAYLDELNRGVTRVDLLAFASELDGYADQLSQGTLHTSLKGHANTIKQIHNQQVVPLEQSMSTLNQSIRLLERTSSDLPIRVREVLEAVDEAQFLISNNATFIVNQETQRYRQTLGRYFRQYLDWIGSALELEVATCKPLSNVLDTAEILACSFLLDSMNTFWFGLGSSTLFLLPSIILSVKLAKFYRRMDTEDVYDDSSISGTWHFTL